MEEICIFFHRGKEDLPKQRVVNIYSGHLPFLSAQKLRDMSVTYLVWCGSNVVHFNTITETYKTGRRQGDKADSSFSYPPSLRSTIHLHKRKTISWQKTIHRGIGGTELEESI